MAELLLSSSRFSTGTLVTATLHLTTLPRFVPLKRENIIGIQCTGDKRATKATINQSKKSYVLARVPD